MSKFLDKNVPKGKQTFNILHAVLWRNRKHMHVVCAVIKHTGINWQKMQEVYTVCSANLQVLYKFTQPSKQVFYFFYKIQNKNSCYFGHAWRNAVCSHKACPPNQSECKLYNRYFIMGIRKWDEMGSKMWAFHYCFHYWISFCVLFWMSDRYLAITTKIMIKWSW